MNRLMIERICALAEIKAPPDGAPLHKEEIPIETLKMATTLTASEGLDVAPFLKRQKEQKCRFLTAMLSGMQQGISPVLLGNMVIRALVEPIPEKSQTLLQQCAQGGYQSFDGESSTSKIPLRECEEGKCVLFDGKIYTGPFIGGRMYGRGVIKSPNGDKCFEGYFFENRPHGKGVMYAERGVVEYDGHFSFGKAHGKGTQYDRHRTATGEWVMGRLIDKNGRVSIQGKNGDTISYEGGVVDGEYQGSGTLRHTNSNGNTVAEYTGGFETNKYHGLGILSNQQSHVIGIWVHGALTITIKRLNASDERPNLNAISKNPTKHLGIQPHTPILETERNETSTHSVAVQTNPVRVDIIHNNVSEAAIHDLMQNELSLPRDGIPATPPKKYTVGVYNLCTLTSMPRRESIFNSVDMFEQLSSAFPHTRVFFTNGRQFHPGTYIGTHQIGNLVSEEQPFLYTVKCPKCVKSYDVEITHQCEEYITLRCAKCENDGVSKEITRSLYCCICAKQEKKPGFSLYKLQNGTKHMCGVHGMTLEY